MRTGRSCRMHAQYACVCLWHRRRRRRRSPPLLIRSLLLLLWSSLSLSISSASRTYMYTYICIRARTRAYRHFRPLSRVYVLDYVRRRLLLLCTPAPQQQRVQVEVKITRCARGGSSGRVMVPLLLFQCL